MKKIPIILLALLCADAYAFDWKSQTNDELRNGMLEYARDFASETKGTKAGRILDELITRQEKAADPYSWVADTHEAVAALKELCGPTVANTYKSSRADEKKWRLRQRTLELLDYPLHVDEKSPDCPAGLRDAYAVSKDTYLSGTRKEALEWLRKSSPEIGKLGIFKVYNMGFFLRTSERIVAIDIRWDGSVDEAKEIASTVDMLFLTHPHRDHYSKTLLYAFAQAGKSVIIPSNVLPEYTAANKILMNDCDTPVNIQGVSVTSLRGNQGDGIPNNVYILEFDGWRIIHQGDNYDREQESRVSDYPAADVLIVSSWNEMKNIVKAADDAEGPSPLLIPAHENELNEHGVSNRESYHELFSRPDRLGDSDFGYPAYVLLDNGEYITLQKGQYIKKGADPEEFGRVYSNVMDRIRQVPGVQVGPDGNLTIRGVNSVNSISAPLILLDGAEVKDISAVNPYDIESVQVLKDAETVIYGFRGVGGVILITTKKGKAQESK